MTLLEVWILYAVFGTSIFSAVFIWAVRNHQFTDFDRARSLALNAADPIEPGEQAGGAPNRFDRYSLPLILIIAFGALASAVVVGIKCMSLHGPPM